MKTDPHKPTFLRYERDGDLVRFTMTNLTNHELREILVGVWCRLDAADRVDHLNELRHYAEDPAAWLSPIAAAVMGNPAGDARLIDLKQLIERGEKIRP